MTKLAIVEENDDQKYDTTSVIKCWKCNNTSGAEIPDAASNPKVRDVDLSEL
jgi:ubiquitin carboxyl-terminal hydrolase 5/13